jgi:hypothetical protein
MTQNLSLVVPDLSNVTLVIHDTPESILSAHWEIPWEELSQGTMGGYGEDGVEEISWNRVLEGMHVEKFWGYASKDQHEIHVWVKEDADPSDVIFFLGHELGHLAGEQIKGDSMEDEVAEENRANEYAEVAKQALQWTNQLLRK